MGLPTEVLRALIEMGATPEMLVAASVAAEERQRADAAVAKAEAAAQDEQRRERRREGNRVRQARFRDRRNANNADNAVTRRDERDPSPKDNNQTPTQPIPPVDPDGSTAPKGAVDAELPGLADLVEAAAAPAVKAGDEKPKAKSDPRGRRLDPGFADSPEAHAVCAEMGVFGAEAEAVLAEFCDFWLSESGGKARKVDWPRTLRNRLREVIRRRPTARAGPNAKPKFSNGFFASLDAEVSDPDDRYADQARPHLRLAAGGRH